MPVGIGVVGGSNQNFIKKRQSNSARVQKGLQTIREALTNNAKALSSKESGLPKDWRNRIFR